MGFVFTILFIVITHLSVDHVLPFLVDFRPMVWLSLMGCLVSLLSIPYAGNVLRSPSILIFLGFFFLPVSRLLHGWLGGAYPALMDFLPTTVAFFLVLVNVTTAKRAKILMISLLFAAFYMSGRGIYEYHFGEGSTDFVMEQRIILDQSTWDLEFVRRIRSTGFLDDPNDFAQYLLVVMPVVGLFYRKGNLVRNVFLVGLPILFLLYTVINTRSRGGALGLFVLLFFFFRDRLKPMASMLLTGATMVMGLGLQFGAGRAISIGGGTDRINIWSDGFGMFKGSPLWGVGYKAFTEYSRLTAHNSYLLAAAELGLIGLFLWMGMVVYCLIHLHRLKMKTQFGQVDPEWAPLIQIIRYGLFGFLVTAYFLSRTYSIDFYILVAMTTILAARAARAPSPAPAEPEPKTEEKDASPDTGFYEPVLGMPKAIQGPVTFNQWFTYSALASFGILGSIYTAILMRSF